MKKALSLQIAVILLVSAIFCIPVNAARETDGTFYYEIDTDTKNTYLIVDCADTLSGAVEIPAEFNGLPVTKISHDAFKNNTAITQVTLPSTITHIRTEAFSGCTGLKKVIGAENLVYIDDNAFYGCTKLSSVAFANNLNYIGWYAFGNCTSLKKFTLPDNVDVYSNAFNGSGIYKTASNWENNLFYIGQYLICAKKSVKGKITVKTGTKYTAISALEACEGITSVTITSTLKEIAEKAFYDCNGLTSVTIPKNVTSIGADAFSSCKALKTVVLGANVKTIGNGAFAYNEKLTSVTFNSKLNTIGESAFNGCSKLKAAKLPSSLKTIKAYAFYNCSSLADISVSDNTVNISANAFSGTKYYKTGSNWESDVLYIGNNLIRAKTSIATNYPIKSGTKNIAEGAFKDCTSLKAVVIPKTVKKIPSNAFYNCSKLTFIYIPEGVTEIGASAFGNCSKLTLVSIPSTVTKIGTKAFVSLKAVYVPETVKKLNSKAINSSAIIYGVTGSAAETFAAKNKNTFSDISEHTHSAQTVEYSVQSVKTPGIKYKKCDGCGQLLSFSVKSQLKPGTVKLSKIINMEYGVELRWKQVSGADAYRVYRKANNAKSWTLVKTVSGTGTYVDYSAKNNTLYTYTVRAQNEVGKGGYDKKGLTTRFVSAPVTTKVENVDSGIKVTWKKVSGADYYYICKRDLSQSDWEVVAKVKGSVTSYLDKNVKSGKDYAYKLKAVNGSYKSDYTNTGDIKHTIRLTTPKLKSATSTKSGVKVTWSKVSNADAYIVYRKTGSGSWKKLADVSGGSKVSYVDKTAKKGTTYTYTVRASKYGNYRSYYNTKGLTVKDKY